MIQDLISAITSKTDLGANEARGGVGVLFNLFEEHADSGLVQSILSSIGGANELKTEFAGEASSGGGGVAGIVGGLLGGSAGDALESLGALKNVGVDMDQAKQLVPMVGAFLKDQADAGQVEQLLDQVPFLKALM